MDLKPDTLAVCWELLKALQVDISHPDYEALMERKRLAREDLIAYDAYLGEKLKLTKSNGLTHGLEVQGAKR